MMDFTKNLERYRSNTGKSVSGLAREVGTNKATMSRYLRGEAFPTVDKIPKIAGVLGVSPADLFLPANDLVVQRLELEPGVGGIIVKVVSQKIADSSALIDFAKASAMSVREKCLPKSSPKIFDILQGDELHNDDGSHSLEMTVVFEDPKIHRRKMRDARSRKLT